MAKTALTGIGLNPFNGIAPPAGDFVAISAVFTANDDTTIVTVDWDGAAGPAGPQTDNNKVDGYNFFHNYADANDYFGFVTTSNGTPADDTTVQIHAKVLDIQSITPTDTTGSAGMINLFFGSSGDNKHNAGSGTFSILEGGSGDDFLIGGTSGGTLIGDQFFGPLPPPPGFPPIPGAPEPGNDKLFGGAGQDLIYGDYVSSAPFFFPGMVIATPGGDDTLRGGGGRDELYGGAGNDVFAFAAGDVVAGEVIDGGDPYLDAVDVNTLQLSGSVSFNLAALSDIHAVRFAAAGAATFARSQLGNGLDASALVRGSAGVNDIRFNVPGNGEINLLSLAFTNWAAEDKVTINGAAGAETLVGSRVGDTINLGAGDDGAAGYDGADRLNGSSGDDSLSGGAGDDSLLGDLGDDTLSGGSDNDRIDGGAADDDILAGAGNDLVVAGTGDDNVHLGSGDDTLRIANVLTNSSVAASIAFTGDDGNDTHIGGSGKDTISFAGVNSGLQIDLAAGTASSRVAAASENIGLDRLFGFEVVVASGGSDIVSGSAAAERLSGGDGRDQLGGGGGEDVLIGGAEADRFMFNALTDSGKTLATADLIDDFSNGVDRISLAGIDAIGSTAEDDSFSATIVNKAAGFTFSTANLNFSAAGQIITFTDGAAAVGADLMIAVNTDADFRTAELMIAVDIASGGAAISGLDFLL